MSNRKFFWPTDLEMRYQYGNQYVTTNVKLVVNIQICEFWKIILTAWVKQSKYLDYFSFWYLCFNIFNIQMFHKFPNQKQ